jgi:phage gp36-like protein
MAYAAQSDLVPLRLTAAELTQLTLDVSSGNPATDAATTASVASAALEEASGVVDSYCRSRYQTPLQPDDDVKGKCLDIAVWLLFSRRRNGKNGDIIRQRYEDAIAFLKDVAANRASLDQPVGNTPQTSLAGPEISDGDRHLKFSDRNIQGFV